MITYTNNWGIYITEHLNPPGELPEFLSCVRVEFYKHETISASFQSTILISHNSFWILNLIRFFWARFQSLKSSPRRFRYLAARA